MTFLRPNSYVLLPALLYAIIPFSIVSQTPPEVQDKNTSATVQFHIVDSYGRPVQYRVESFVESDNPKVDLAPQFRDLVLPAAAVLGKTYKVRFSSSEKERLFPAFNEEITVYDPSTYIFFAVPESLFVPDYIGPYPVTRLVLDHPLKKASSQVWATVRPAFLPIIDDLGPETVRVNTNGSFELKGTHGGTYLVTVCEDNKILGIGTVDIPLLATKKALSVHLK